MPYLVAIQTPLDEVKGISPRFLKYLQKMGLHTVRDLIWHFPARYEDFSQIYKIADLEPGQQATIQAAVEDVDVRRTWRRRMSIVEATVADESGSLKVVWFNQPYIAQSLRAGKIANFAGKVSVSEEGELYLSHPAYEIVPRTHADQTQTHAEKNPRNSAYQLASVSGPRHTARLVPIYPETRGLTSKGLRFIIQPLLQNLERLPEWLPWEVLKNQNLPEINRALRAAHFPARIEDATLAKKRFAFEDLFLLQLLNFKQKLRLAETKAPIVRTNIEIVKKFLAELPFELTFSQKRSLWEIIKDLEKPHPMNRLLQGDVGSGKTVVAAIAASIAAENGYQTALMAPTEVLARQHFLTFKKLISGKAAFREPVIGLLTASESKIIYASDLETDVKKTELQKKVKSGEVKIVIGTHALIQKTVGFKKLGLVVIDEQHRFGVRQRQELARGQTALMVPHFLSMSATPIPRTLMLTVFGDLDISTITELPAGRKNIATQIVPPEDRQKIYAFIRAEVKSGRQVFVICPRIEPSQTNADNMRIDADQKLQGTREFRSESAFSPRKSALLWETKAVKEEYKKLGNIVFPDLKVAMLHGQMPAKGGSLPGQQAGASGRKPSKEQVMNDFRNGKIDILVSTSVIEVGVDIPNATIIMIEGAERFGLAQLYQFRGRVGRGPDQSYCFLFTTEGDQVNRPRLKAILAAKNGFELAEMDLKIRGPGEFLGETQTGFPDVAMSALQDVELVKASRAAAADIIQKDPEMEGQPLLKQKLDGFQKKVHLE